MNNVLQSSNIQSLVLSILMATIALFGVTSLAQASHNSMPDTDEDGFISVAEGVPFYGGIVHSLTTDGDVGPESALALDRFPLADDDGEYDYKRTFTLQEDLGDLTNAHIVIHGIDLNKNGAYDGEKESSIAAGVPFEATVPAACGEFEFEDDGEYEVDIRQLNSTGAYGEAEITIAGDQITVELEMENVSPEIAHAQHIHIGGDSVCPPNTVGVGEGEYDDDNNDSDDNDKTDRRLERIIENQIKYLERLVDRLERQIETIKNRIERLSDLL